VLRAGYGLAMDAICTGHLFEVYGTSAFLTLPYLTSGVGRLLHLPSSAQCASPNVTTRLQVAAIKP